MTAAALILLNMQTGGIAIEAAHGISVGRKRGRKHKLREGITAKVITTGGPLVVSKVSEKTQFPDRTGARRARNKGNDLSFICVPIKMGQQIVGALSADLVVAAVSRLREEARVLSIIASLIARAVKLRQSAYEERKKLIEENLRLKEELRERFRPSNIVGNSKTMQNVHQLIGQAATSDTTVLLSGESGTGKELVAQTIHYASGRSSRPFVKVNCAALPEGVIESELFGHERGAFTGAIAARKGRFEQAQGGTLFLDEIGDLSPAMQVKLLRVLQEREFARAGGVMTITVDVRLIAATNKNLEDLIVKEQFREDLYYRLSEFSIRIPSLRERRRDIPLLVDYFVKRYSGQNKKKAPRVSRSAIDMLITYHWPGNVRELENCIERAVLLCNEEVIHGYHLPPSIQTAESSGTPSRGTFSAVLETVERDLLIDALKLSRGNMTKAASRLGITPRLMGLRVRKYRILPMNYERP